MELTNADRGLGRDGGVGVVVLIIGGTRGVVWKSQGKMIAANLP